MVAKEMPPKCEIIFITPKSYFLIFFLTAKRLCITLKCIGGPHIGARFRLQPDIVRPIALIFPKASQFPLLFPCSLSQGEEDYVAKIGRSTGRHFKERGCSLYKDKETSSTHARVSAGCFCDHLFMFLSPSCGVQNVFSSNIACFISHSAMNL